MFSFSTGNVSWLLAQPCLLPLLHPSRVPSHGGSRTRDPVLAPLALGARGELREGSGGRGAAMCGWTAEVRPKGFLSLFSPKKWA